MTARTLSVKSIWPFFFCTGDGRGRGLLQSSKELFLSVFGAGGCSRWEQRTRSNIHICSKCNNTPLCNVSVATNSGQVRWKRLAILEQSEVLDEDTKTRKRGFVCQQETLQSTQLILHNYLSNMCSAPGRVRTVQPPSIVCKQTNKQTKIPFHIALQPCCPSKEREHMRAPELYLDTGNHAVMGETPWGVPLSELPNPAACEPWFLSGLAKHQVIWIPLIWNSGVCRSVFGGSPWESLENKRSDQ